MKLSRTGGIGDVDQMKKRLDGMPMEEMGTGIKRSRDVLEMVKSGLEMASKRRDTFFLPNDWVFSKQQE